VLIVADQGKATSAGIFTGEGAKIFVLPVLLDGSSGEPVVLWEQKPFKCPTGVAVVGNYIYITDPCAGPLRQDPMNPGYSFPISAIFAIPLIAGNVKSAAKTPPILLRQGEPFVSLNGICSLVPGEIVISDTDSGDPDAGELGTSGFAPPKTSDQWVLKILDPQKPLLSEPARTNFTVRGDVRLDIQGIQEAINVGLLSENTKIEVSGLNGSQIITNQGPVDKTSFPISSLSGTNKIDDPLSKILATEFWHYSPGNGVGVVTVQFGKTRTCQRPSPYTPRMPLDPNGGKLNKENPSSGVRPRNSPKAGLQNARGSTIYDRFTLDNAKGHGSVWIYPDGGGSPVAIAIGAPLLRPFAGQLSPNQEQLWFTDQENGSLYSVPFPSPAVFDSLYGVKKIIR